MKKNKEKVVSEEKKENTELSFLEKYKTDSKYKAKIQLIGWGIFLLVLIIYLNIAELSSPSKPLTNTVTPIRDTEKENAKLGEWLDKIGNNYEYEVNIATKKKDGENIVSDEVRYFGISNLNRLTIDRSYQGNTLHYRKEADQYYFVVDENTYQEVLEEDVYSIIKAEYVTKEGMKNFLENASLDHVTNYSSGKKEYEYHLKVRDMIKTYQGDDEITFQVSEENGQIKVEVDYAPLLKELSLSYTECKVSYLYQNIGKVEEIQAISTDKIKKVDENE